MKSRSPHAGSRGKPSDSKNDSRQKTNNKPVRTGSQVPKHRHHGGGPTPQGSRVGASRKTLHSTPALGKHDRFVIGFHSVKEALSVRPESARELWLREDHMSSQALTEFAELAQRLKIPIRTKSLGQLEQIGSAHQGVAVWMTGGPTLQWQLLKDAGPSIVMVLDGIEDPHNLGSILRTSWLMGVKGVLIPADRAVQVTPTVCKVASGGAEHVPVESHVNLPAVLKDLKEMGFWVYGLSEKGTPGPWRLKLPEKVVWVIGSEGSGIRIPTERACDELVRIPQVASGSSYNAAIAAGIALAETCRQFGKPE